MGAPDPLMSSIWGTQRHIRNSCKTQESAPYTDSPSGGALECAASRNVPHLPDTSGGCWCGCGRLVRGIGGSGRKVVADRTIAGADLGASGPLVRSGPAGRDGLACLLHRNAEAWFYPHVVQRVTSEAETRWRTVGDSARDRLLVQILVQIKCDQRKSTALSRSM